MYWFNRNILSLLIILPSFIWGQNCHYSIRGKLVSIPEGIPVSEVRLEIKELNVFTFSDQEGNFDFQRLCSGSYHLGVHHVAYEEVSLFFDLNQDTILNLSILPLNEFIREVDVIGQHEENNLHSSQTLHTHSDQSKPDENLARSISDMAGLSTISNGSAIAKPVIHGMWGNRVSIINNGIAQGGQQWGSDHAPEIDPFIADHITVLKGSSALAYPGSNLGGVVLVETPDQPVDPHLHGGVHYSLQTNGRGNTANIKLEKAGKWMDWWIMGSLKYFGDRRSPDYFLTNTGNRESDLAISLFRDFSKRWKNNVYYSYFRTELGVLKGSHVNNITDLEDALTREEPLYTKDHFSYTIEAPRQLVTHHLVKAESRYQLNDHSYVKFCYGGQLNQRDEFDIRRAGRSDLPALSLHQWSHFLEGRYTHLNRNGTERSAGLQYTFVDNTNDNSSTGRLPLIPDYQSYRISLFGYSNHKLELWSYEYGFRVNTRFLDVRNITRTVPREIERSNHSFVDLNLSASLLRRWNSALSTSLDFGWVQRQPEINELYSSGLHQGVASIEYGNPDLHAEHSFKTMLNIEWKPGKNFRFQLDSYYQQIRDYIYLKPTGELELTISGAFPVFVYDQTDARIVGTDFTRAVSQ